MWIRWLICAVLHTYPAFTQSSGVPKEETHDVVPCERGLFLFRDKCYKLGGKRDSARLTWKQASKKCKSEGGNIATIQSKELQEFLVTFLLLDAKTSSWIGLHDRINESDYTWGDGSTVNYTNWEPGEPSGLTHEEEDCVEMVFRSHRDGGMTGQWNDLPCSRSLAYICEFKKGKKLSPDPRLCSDFQGGWKYQNSCYHVVSDKKTWEGAELHCQDIFNGHLVTISDFTVDIFLEYILSNFNSEMWIGIKIQDESLQQWTSGWYVGYNEWDKDQRADFVHGTCSLRSRQKLWRNALCSRKFSFICETSSDAPPVLKQPVEGALCPEKSENWWDLGGEYCYFIVIQSRLNWYKANFECIRRGGSLVSIHSDEETMVLQQFIKFTQNSIYIGLLRLKTNEVAFVWTDGSLMDYKNWDASEPNKDEERCGELSTRNMKWNDVNCDEERGYICSVRKVLPNVTEISMQSECPSGVSIGVVIGVSVCILVVVILIAIVCYCLRIGEEHRKKMSSCLQQQPAVPSSHRLMYRSAEIIIKDNDEYFERLN